MIRSAFCLLLAGALAGCGALPPPCTPDGAGLISALQGTCTVVTTTQAWTCAPDPSDDACQACARASCCDEACTAGGTCDGSPCLADHCAQECPQ